jgi:hypothetical protein
MAKEIRIVKLVPGQQSPEGCHGIGVTGGILWEGEAGTFPTETYLSTLMSVADYGTYTKTVIRQQANNHLKDDTTDDPWWQQRNAALGLYSSEVTAAINSIIANTMTESNRCEDAIDAATTIEQVQAVEATWPTE